MQTLALSKIVLVSAIAFASLVSCAEKVKFNHTKDSKPKSVAAGQPNTSMPEPSDAPLAPPKTSETQTQTQIQAPPPVTELVFGNGTTDTYHLGNGEFGQSSCIHELQTTKNEGKIMYFKFNLDAPGNILSISINKICGLDITPNFAGAQFSKISEASLLPLKSQVPVLEFGPALFMDAQIMPALGLGSFQKNIQTSLLTTNLNGGTLTLTPTQQLPAGAYALKIEAGYTSSANLQNIIDDFLIGQINIKANVPMSGKDVEFMK